MAAAPAPEMNSSVVSVVAPRSVSGLDQIGLDRLVLSIEAAEQQLSSLRIRVAARAEKLHVQDSKRNKTAEDTLRGSGKSPSRETKRQAKAAREAGRNPDIGERVDDIPVANLDALARALDGVSSQERQKLDMKELAHKAATESADRFARTIKPYIDDYLQPDLRAEEKRRHKNSFLKHWFDPVKQMGHIYAELDPIRYEKVAKALDKKVSQLANQPSSTPTKKDRHTAAEALHQLITVTREVGNGSSLPELLIVVDQKTAMGLEPEQRICETENGVPVSVETFQQHACNTNVRTVELGSDGVPINVGRRFRTATGAQWSALKAIYRSCAWAECGTRIGWCQPHHIKYWRHGGKTDLDNLVPLCSDHHHLVHDENWKIRLKGNRSLEIKRPDGSNYYTTDPPRRSP